MVPFIFQEATLFDAVIILKKSGSFFFFKTFEIQRCSLFWSPTVCHEYSPPLRILALEFALTSICLCQLRCVLD